MLLKVVIIEDNPITVRSLVETIKWETLGCEVAGTALDGEAGCQLILSTRPDIILTDIRMPKCDGLEMIETVRQSVPDCKVIIITGYDQFQYASRAIKLAIFDYLLKPIDSEELINCVRRAVDATLSRQAIDVTQQQGGYVAPPRPTVTASHQSVTAWTGHPRHVCGDGPVLSILLYHDRAVVG